MDTRTLSHRDHIDRVLCGVDADLAALTKEQLEPDQIAMLRVISGRAARLANLKESKEVAA